LKTFRCQCGQLLFFENNFCVKCQTAVGFAPGRGEIVAVEGYRRCANDGVCNWLLEDDKSLCLSCRLTRTIPDQFWPRNAERWARLEAAKRRLLFSLLYQLRVPVEGMTFDFLAPEAGPVLTGHANGVITVNAGEADDDQRERTRAAFDEPYRTLLGHLRHESGHFYWDRLVQPGPLEEFRELFGDEREDYGQALERHHSQGPPPDWQERGFISSYASAHPWEDWAETWAHYLHIIDTMETARAFDVGVRVRARVDGLGDDDLAETIEDWVQLTLVLNSLNRSMGLPDLYPFVLSTSAAAKLSMVHRLVRG